MKEQVLRYYFPMIKFVYMLLLSVYFIVSGKGSLNTIGIVFCILSGIMVCSVVNELLTDRRLFLLIAEVGFMGILLYLGEAVNMIVFPIVMLDIIVYMKGTFRWYMSPAIGILWYGEEAVTYAAICIFTVIVYVQHYLILCRYAEDIRYYEKEESHLKMSLDQTERLSRRKLEKNRLHYENVILEEKNRISQALHDRLGHSINGAVYQLEASKVLLSNEPNKSMGIIQRVIDELRGSMDEIRAMIRSERPNGNTTALLQLNQLCDDCKGKYGITASLCIDGDEKRIPDETWEIILDNTFEAVSNALKYADCTSISIEIVVLNRVIRCAISDDGKGCESVAEGMGLQGMKQRVRKIGGSMDIMSEAGFTIRMILPTRSGRAMEEDGGK